MPLKQADPQKRGPGRPPRHAEAMTERLNVRMTHDLAQAVRQAARAEGTDTHELCRRALTAYLETLPAPETALQPRIKRYIPGKIRPGASPPSTIPMVNDSLAQPLPKRRKKKATS